MNKTSRNYFLLAIILFIVSFFYCKDGRTNEAVYVGSIPSSDTTYIVNARTDTTKPTINHRYVLKGSDTMFILLQNLILSPDDVTPRQKNIVVDWFRQNVKIDSTKNH